MLNTKTLKVGDKIRSLNQFSLIQEGTVTGIDALGAITVDPTKPITGLPLVIFPSGYGLYEVAS